MEVLILASGSKGNALIIKANNTKILVDIGITYPNFTKKTKNEDVNVNNISALFLTHEHSDHIKGLKRYLQNHPEVNVYLSKGTYDAIDLETRNLLINYKIIKSKDIIIYNELEVTVYDLSHDASEPVGYVFKYNNKKAVIATDTGYIDEQNFEILKNADLYILEANHEPALLMDSKRPYYLKQRIIGTKGHLSNSEAAWLINEFIKESNNSTWAVAHISEDCNTEYHIEKSIVEIVEDPTKLEVLYTSQETMRKIKLWLKLFQLEK